MDPIKICALCRDVVLAGLKCPSRWSQERQCPSIRRPLDIRVGIMYQRPITLGRETYIMSQTHGLTPVYEGKAKILYSRREDDRLIQRFKDDATAFNGVKKAQIAGKGVHNCQISSRLFRFLGAHGIPTHFVEQISDTDQLVERLAIIPLEVVVRNVVAGSLAKRLGLDEGTELSRPIVETYYKRDDLGDPLITRDHIFALDLASATDLDRLREQALLVNELLVKVFAAADIDVVDFKLEFGRNEAGEIRLGDEISPDTCRFWDKETGRKLDKDVFRRDLGDLVDGYAEVLARLKSLEKRFPELSEAGR